MAPKSSSIGQLLLKDDIISQKQLERAKRVHAKLEVKQRLTEVLIKLGYVREAQVREIMRKNKKELRIGDFLIEMGLITEVQLDRALKQQKSAKRKLGDILIEEGVLSEMDFCRALSEQLDFPIINPDLRVIDDRLLKQVSLRFLRKHILIPFSQSEHGVVVIFADPLDEETLAAASQAFHGELMPAISTKKSILDTLELLAESGEKTSVQAKEPQDIIKIVNYLIESAIDEEISDIHIEPMPNRVRVRYRKDGVLVHKTDFPKELQESLLSRVKVMAGADIADKRRHQDGKINYTYYSNKLDIRMSSYVTLFGENIVLRILNQQTSLKGLDELGIAPRILKKYIIEVLEPSTGVVIMTGPTGSGKTTTLYSSIDYCNDPSLKIITAEDPVEYVINGIVQCSINEQIGLTYDETLRAIVRQDPDIIVLGEIRDKRSAEVAITAALTGHKVFSTFHTEDSIGGIIRLMDMGIETFLISSTVLSILAQRLLRKICPNCKEKFSPNPIDLRRIGFNLDEVRSIDFYRGAGCEQCHYTGYQGRIGVYELLVLNEKVRNAILRESSSMEIRDVGVSETGLTTLLEDGLTKIVKGITTPEEVRKRVPYAAIPRPLETIMSLTE